MICAPTMLIYGFYNWDLMIVALVMLSILALAKHNFKVGGFISGLAIATKVYSIVLIPVMLTSFKTWKERTIFSISCFIGWLLPNLPFMALNFDGWFQTWIYHKNWGLENSWLLLLTPNDHFSFTVKLFGFGLMGLALLHITFLTKKDNNLPQRLLMAALCWLLFSYVSTPQMVLFLLPLFAMNEIRFETFYISEVANVLLILTWFTVPDPLAIWSTPQVMNLIRQSIWFGLLLYMMFGKNVSLPRLKQWLTRSIPDHVQRKVVPVLSIVK